MNMENKKCYNCGSKEFITEPNKYDVVTFEDGKYTIVSVETIDDFKIFCRECSSELKLDRTDNQYI